MSTSPIKTTATPFSIVIPLYNKKSHIKDTLDSVLSQDYDNYEIVVVNDGSQDGSEEIVETLSKEQPEGRIRLINQENGGVSVARNTGIKNSKHDMVCLLDADDEWKAGYLKEMDALVRDFPGYKIYSVRHEIKEEGDKIIFPAVELPDDFRGVIPKFIPLYTSSDGIIHSSAVCLNRDYCIKLGGFPEGQKLGEDVYVWLLYGMNTQLVFSNKVLMRYSRVTENRSDVRVEKMDLPYYFRYFFQKLKEDSCNPNNKDLLAYMRKNAWLHLAGLKLAGNGHIAKQHAKQFFQKDTVTGTPSYLIAYFPNFILSVIKKLRDTTRASD
ncbi:MAG: glycosyltransferase family A protein [Cocleimonas sp.]